MTSPKIAAPNTATRNIAGRKFALIVGGIKCGTTSLFRYLSEHPEIAPCVEKEPKFFNRRYDRGAKYYKSLWDWKEINDQKVALEATPSYTRFTTRNPENSAKKIAEFKAQENVEFKFIYLLRDPIERIESHYNHSQIYPRTKVRPISEGVDAELIEISKYAMQIGEYYQRFPAENILLLNFDDFKQDSQATLVQVCQFLGIDSNHQFEKSGVVYNSQDQRRKLAFPGLSLLERTGLKSVASQLLSEERKQVARRILGRKQARVKLSQGHRDYILKALQEDLEHLRSHYGFDVNRWKNVEI